MACIVDLLDDHESIGDFLSEHGAYGFTPVPAAADGSGVVLVNYFSGKSRLVLVGSVGNEIFSAVGKCPSDISGKSVDVLAAYRHAVLEGNSVIDIYKRIDASDLSAV